MFFSPDGHRDRRIKPNVSDNIFVKSEGEATVLGGSCLKEKPGPQSALHQQEPGALALRRAPVW